MNVLRSFFTFAVVLCTILGLSAVAMAEGGATSRVTELPLTVINGRPQTPAAGYILTRSGQHYEVRDLRESFVREVVRSVDGGPF
jgi:hypothetical protein